MTETLGTIPFIHSFSHWFLKRLEHLLQALCWMGTSSLFHGRLGGFQRAWVVGFFFFFFFSGKKVDQVFSLSPWPGHCPSLQGEMVALDPGGWPRPLPALRLCVSLSVCLQVSWIMHLIRDSWAWKLWGSGWEAHWLLGRGKSPLVWSSPSAVAATSPQRDWEAWHLCIEYMCSLTFGWWLWSLFTGLPFMALPLYGVPFVPPELRFVWFCAGSVWNQFSNLYPKWAELEYPHWKASGTKHCPLSLHTVSSRPSLLFGKASMGWMWYWFYRMWDDMYPNPYSVFFGTQWTAEIILWDLYMICGSRKKHI